VVTVAEREGVLHLESLKSKVLMACWKVVASEMSVDGCDAVDRVVEFAWFDY
jgi:hypothetical protein